MSTGIQLPNNIHPAVAAHIDDRYEVATFADINSNGPLYAGMVRYVKSEDRVYRRTATGTWVIDTAVKGDTGAAGTSATIQIGTVTSGASPQVTNSGTSSAAILNFVLVKGDTGAQGLQGLQGIPGVKGDKGDIGPAFNIDGRGTYADRSLLDSSEPGTAYLVEDVTSEFDGNIFIKNDDGSWSEAISFVGDRGWTPVIAATTINENKIVLKLVDFIGGKGAKPLDTVNTAYYVGNASYTSDVNLAINIKGTKGDQGTQGAQGLKGDQGIQGTQGNQGASIYVAYADDATGINASFNPIGKAYMSVIQSVSSPAIEAFTVWFQFKGEDGIIGSDGEDGKSAYQIWLDLGNIGTEQDFIDSLKGESGDGTQMEFIEATEEAASNIVRFNNPFGHYSTDYLNGSITFIKNGSKKGATCIKPYTSTGVEILQFNFSHYFINTNYVDGNTLPAGNYELFFGNRGDKVSISIVNVGSEFTYTPPVNQPTVITLNGANPYNMFVGSTYSEPGYTATDDIDGEVTTNVIVTNNINSNIEGSYTVTYSITDSEGLVTTVTRTVNVNAVVQDNPPSAPGTPTFTNITSSASTVNWTAATDDNQVAGYNIYVNGIKVN